MNNIGLFRENLMQINSKEILAKVKYTFVEFDGHGLEVIGGKVEEHIHIGLSLLERDWSG